MHLFDGLLDPSRIIKVRELRWGDDILSQVKAVIALMRSYYKAGSSTSYIIL